MPDPEQQGLDATVAPTQHAHRPYLQMVEECRKIVSHPLVR